MNQLVTTRQEPNKDQSFLKLVAILTMLVDHTGVVFFPGVLWLRIIGRIAFPLFCWGIVLGVERTKNWRLYGLRLFLMAIVSQAPFALALSHQWDHFNVVVTLFLGFLAIVGIQHKWYHSQVWAPILCVFIAAGFQMDYSWPGVLLIILMYLAKDSKGGLAALMVAFCLYWAGGQIVPHSFVHRLSSTGFRPLDQAVQSMLSLVKIQSLAILALPFMLIPTNSGIRLPKWFSYLAYPAHLMLLWLLTLIL
ncbi:MAG: hypothetical protein GXZ04_08885 [Clostridiales bacterium]|nr:hypothetical protein [Clostridiales bacterium]